MDAIAIAIIMPGIGASVSFPDLPQQVFHPMVEKGVEVFKPIAWALALAFGVVVAIFIYRKWLWRNGGDARRCGFVPGDHHDLPALVGQWIRKHQSGIEGTPSFFSHSS